MIKELRYILFHVFCKSLCIFYISACPMAMPQVIASHMWLVAPTLYTPFKIMFDGMWLQGPLTDVS